MASDFVGYKVKLTLNAPPNAEVERIVANVIAQQLFLRDVVLLWNGQHLPSYVVDSRRIADLEVAPEKRDGGVQPQRTAHSAFQQDFHPSHTNSQSSELSSSTRNAKQAPFQSSPQAFVDPAILSYNKPMIDVGSASRRIQPLAEHATLSPVMIGDSTLADTPVTAVFEHGQGPRRTDSSATATLREPFNSLSLNSGHGMPTSSQPQKSSKALEHGEEIAPTTTTKAGKKSRRGARKSGKDAPSQTGPGIIDVNDLNTSPVLPKKSEKGKGWRQTPLIEETSPRKTKHTKNKKSLAEDANGWATEDATDIQDMGEFDFESNLSKFDKRRVFDDIRSKDQTAEADRLVSFNRKARPGTNGGRNLHYSENVLDPPQDTGHWKSEAGETEEEGQDERLSSSRVSLREQSRTRGAAPSRKGSALPNHSFPPSMSREASSRTNSPLPSINRVGTAPSPMNGQISRASFRIERSNKPCPCVSPLQMLEIEQLCISELGMTEEMLAENAARGIAQAALQRNPPLASTSTILVLAGNHKSGARAVAAARQLRNHMFRVSVCILGGEREDLLFESLRRQLDIYKRGGGWVVKWDELQPRLADSTPHLIIESLLGIHTAFEDLRLEDQASAFEMIRWANRSKVPILSVDVPSGLLANTGQITQTDSGSLVVYSKDVVCLGAPKTGLLESMAHHTEDEKLWFVCVADTGISNVAWKKYGTRRRHGVDFGSEWVVGLKYQGN